MPTSSYPNPHNTHHIIQRQTMSHKIFWVLLLAPMFFSSCTQWQGETVETAYVLPPYPDPEYKFTRNGSSSVDYLECSLLRDPLNYIYDSYLKEANILYRAQFETMKNYWDNGEFGLKPRNEISASPLHQADSALVKRDVEDIFNQSAALSGMGKEGPGTARNQKAKPGKAGYLGRNIGDVNLAFANEKGLVVAELFKGIVYGGIYLDKILNTHLNDSVLNSEALRRSHEANELVAGHNYTVLEHHWDLAYGYYQFWLPYVQTSNAVALRQSRITLYNAFAAGRAAITQYRYADMLQQQAIIRTELAKVAATRAVTLLTGATTMANIHEDEANALTFLSEACGAIYALQFTVRPSGKPHFSYNEVKNIIQELTAGTGLWDKQRLLGPAATAGSLQNVALQVAQTYGLSLQ